MTTTTSYTNCWLKPIADQQLNQKKEYNKIFNENGNIKKIEYYDENELTGIDYYKDPSENINDVFAALDTNTVAVIQLENYGVYQIETTLSYIEGVIKNEEKHLLQDGKIICVQESVDGIIKIDTTLKYLYGAEGKEIGEELFTFHYNEDGTLNFINGFGYPFSEYNQALKANEIPTYFPNLLIEDPYYVDANFLP